MTAGTGEFRGFRGSVEWSEEDRLWFGKILGVRDLILYDAPTRKALKTAFRRAVREYIDDLKKLGREVEIPKPRKGLFLLEKEK